MGENVTSIYSSAFYETAFYNNASNWKNGALYLSNCLIATNDSISPKYTVKDGTKAIATYAFAYDGFLRVEGNEIVTEVTICDSVKVICMSAFENCTNLKNVKIGNGVESIEKWAFAGCTSLASIVIPDSVVTIGDEAFFVCYDLENVVIGKNVKTIGKGAFSHGLTSLEFKNTNGWWCAQKADATAGINISSAELADKSTAASCMNTYAYYYWNLN